MSSVSVVTTLDAWMKNYKEQNLEVRHDKITEGLATPEESIIFAGPAKMADSSGSIKFLIIGFSQGIQYQEQSQLQPHKPIGSRRHIFSKTNGPVQGTIERLVAYAPNLLRALYSFEVNRDDTSVSSFINQKFSNDDDYAKSNWYVNLEEDLFRRPVGLGVLYSAPYAMNKGSKYSIGGDYLEVCMIQSRAISIRPGQTVVMEQVSFLADRVVPVKAYKQGESPFQN